MPAVPNGRFASRFQTGKGHPMQLLVTYDVATTTSAGRRRLRRVARVCADFGQRVQKSVFECAVDDKSLVILRSRLLDEINLDEDSLRLYRLMDVFADVVEHYGRDPRVDYEGPLIV
jgi:CRISPR-associated protein Cas2